MELDLEGDSTLVTASSSGLGKAAAGVLAEEGANVVVNGRNEDRLRATVAELREAATGEVVGVRGDITAEETRTELVTTAVERFGGLDHLVTSAGGVASEPFLETPPSAWRDAYDLLVMSVAGLVHETVDHLRAGDGGTIVTITSIYSKEAVESYVLSNSVRMGVIGLTKTLSRELAPEIRANSVLPGWHATSLTLDPVREGVEDGTYESMEEGRRDRIADYPIPLDRMGDPEELGNAVAFLCSKRSGYINGTAIPVDGGLSRSNL